MYPILSKFHNGLPHDLIVFDVYGKKETSFGYGKYRVFFILSKVIYFSDNLIFTLRKNNNFGKYTLKWFQNNFEFGFGSIFRVLGRENTPFRPPYKALE